MPRAGLAWALALVLSIASVGAARASCLVTNQNQVRVPRVVGERVEPKGEGELDDDDRSRQGGGQDRRGPHHQRLLQGRRPPRRTGEEWRPPVDARAETQEVAVPRVRNAIPPSARHQESDSFVAGRREIAGLGEAGSLARPVLGAEWRPPLPDERRPMSFAKSIFVLAPLTVVLAVGSSAHATDCTKATDCAKGFTCVILPAEPPPTPACEKGTICPVADPGPASPPTSGSCELAPCTKDDDCGTGMVCYTTTESACSGGVAVAGSVSARRGLHASGARPAGVHRHQGVHLRLQMAAPLQTWTAQIAATASPARLRSSGRARAAAATSPAAPPPAPPALPAAPPPAPPGPVARMRAAAPPPAPPAPPGRLARTRPAAHQRPLRPCRPTPARR